MIGRIGPWVHGSVLLLLLTGFACNKAPQNTPTASDDGGAKISLKGTGNDSSTSNNSPAGTEDGTVAPIPPKPAKFEGPTAKSGKIKIVSSLPRTGSAKGQTDTIVNGIKLALEEVNYKVGDFTIEYEDLDDATAQAGQWDAQRETSNAQRAVQDLDVMVYIGTYNSGAAKIAMPILNRADLLMISPANTTPSLTKPNTGDKDEPARYRPTGRVNYFRVVPTDDVQGPVAAWWAKKMKVKSVYILDDGEAYGKGIADLFKSECEDERVRIKVLGQETIDVRAQEFRALMLKIKKENPDLVYFGGTTQTKAGQLAKDMKSVGLDCPFMVPDGCYEKAFIESAGADVLNGRCYVTFGGLPPSELVKQGGKSKAFVEAYERKFGKMPDEAYAVYGYECALVALEAIRRAGEKNRQAITYAAHTIRNFQGALGTWSFDANGDTTLRVMSGSVVRDGQFQFETLLNIPPKR